MKVFRNIDDPGLKKPAILTFGVFDGLHVGHQLIMKMVVERTAATGFAATTLTFDPHPRAVLHPDTAPLLLQTFEQKMDGLERLGIEQAVVMKFDDELASVSAEDFLLDVVFGKLDAQEVYLGHGFAFGHNREGRFELLERVAERLGRVAKEVPEVSIRGRRVSSTMIRRLLGSGRVNLARRMLGKPYSIEGHVIEGRRLGKEKLGYPTANLRPQECVVPATGVYITVTQADGEWRRSIANVGHRPTVGLEPETTAETHIFDFDRDLYGERIRIRFLHRLRGEIKFESLDALRRQIDRDCQRALAYFDKQAARENIEFT